ncbi:MAG TPA: ornithine carbamoyltransferase [Syntrophobacter fumaroxidans]|nr:ornithine carbamoyltransferase [Syntrophobacter fumaroxidans]
MKRDLLSIRDLSADEIVALISRAETMKRELAEGNLRQSLRNKVVALIFVKPSTRTRVSFEAAIYRLGGHSIFMSARDTQISRQEPLADTARVLARYVDAIVIRTFAQEDVTELARYASIPVINGLTDRYHPCQVLGDLLTIKEKRGTLENLHVAWIGDGNNVAHSWINAAARLGFTVSLACPSQYLPDREILEWAEYQGKGKVIMAASPKEAVASADALYTDVWASMGQEEEADARRSIFRPFQVNEGLLSAAPAHAIVLHCLPAHRGEEITNAVMEGPQSAIFDQAENRLHIQMALLDWLLSDNAPKRGGK